MWTFVLYLLVHSFINCVSFDGSHMTTGLAASDGVCLFVPDRDVDTRQMSHHGGGDTRQMYHPEGLNSTLWSLGRGEFGNADHDVIHVTVFEKDVIIPPDDVRINVDILHDLPVFLELHESGDLETFSLRIEASIKGSDPAEHGLMFDFMVTSLGLITTVKVHLRYSNDGYHPTKLDISWILDTWVFNTWIPLLVIWIFGFVGYRKYWIHDSRGTYNRLTSQHHTPELRVRIFDTPEVGGKVLKCMAVCDVCPTGSGQDRAKQNGNGTCQREETRERKGDNAKNAKQGLISSRPRRKVGNFNSAERDTMTKVPGQVTFDPNGLMKERSDRNSQRVGAALTPGRQWKGRRYLRVVPLLVFTTLVLASVAVGLSRLRVKPTVHVTFPSSNIIRQVRMFSQFPDLSELSKNHSSLSLVSRLQLLDTQPCKYDLNTCKIKVVCETSTDQSVNCRCRTGFFFHSLGCHACKTQCPADHYLASSCSETTDAICKPCTACTPTQYEAAQCNTQRDTICIDVSFPVGILPANKSHIPDDESAIWVGHSPNVFMERLVNMESLETPMYITNNVQGLDFAWPRLSGLDIAVSISGVFLIPNYRDLEAVDDTALFMLLQDNSQDMKDKYKFIQKHFCRHPVPDYYSLQLEVIANRTAKAQVVMCDSHDATVPRCPPHHKDGTRYLQWDISQPCPFINTSQRFDKVTGGRNSVVCTEETELLRKVFQSSRPTTQEYMFPSQECTSSQRECSQCLEASQCRENRNVNVSFLHDKYCCGISCYTKGHCQKYYSHACPPPKVECGLGDVNIFSLYPNFDSMTHQFACHLKYEPPQQLYSISYTIRAPSINLNITPQNFTVSSRSREDHEKRLSSFDFINAFHDTRYKVEDELILIGDHYDFIRNFDNLMKPCIVHKIKDPRDLRRQRKFTQDSYTKHVFIQFEKPFLYSSLSWHSDQCQKNMSQIYPNQTIYEDEFIPMLARKNQHESPNSQQNSGFMYQLNQRERAPYIKFYVERGKSVLQHLQGTVIKGKLIPSSLLGRVSWNHQIGKWMLDISGQQDACPTILSLKIFTQLMTGCAGHFDLLINCPRDFSVQLNFSTDLSDLPDIFVVQVNDSSTSHNLVLSSIYPPLHVDEMGQENPSPPSQELTSVDGAIKLYSMWAPICFIVLLTLISLLVIFIVHTCINAKVTGNMATGRADTETPLQETPLQAQDGKIKNANPSSHFKQKRNVLIGCFIFLYVIYCILFSFTLTFSVVYFPISMYWSNLSSLNQLGQELGVQVDSLLHNISKFEQDERARLFSLYQRQRTACTVHLEQENSRLLDDYQQTTAKQVQAIFVENGTLHSLSNAIIQQNVSVYMQQINEFVADCNKTVEAIVQRFQAKYYHFLSNTVLNDWLKVPRQIFLYQEGEDVNKQFLSSTWVKQFAVWLEIDKAEELLAVSENVFGRMSSIEAPRVSVLNLTFPSVYPHVMNLEPEFDYHNHSYTYIVQAPMTNQEMQHFNLSLPPSGSEILNFRKKRSVDEFGLSGNLMSNPDSQEFSHTSARSTDVNSSPDNKWVDNDFDHYASYLSNNFQTKKKIRSRKMKDTEDVGELLFQEKDTTMKGIQNDEHVENLVLDQSSDSYKLDNPPAAPDSNKLQDSKIPYILIGIFLTLDIFLWLYRFSWCSDQVYAARHGYADRIPTDEACKHFFEIQTAYHLPTFEHPHDESSGYYVDIKEHLNPEKDSPDITFLQDLPKQKDNKDDILQKIWNEKMNKSKEMGCLAQCCLVRWCHSAKKILQRLFLSKLAWQGSITFTAILFICLFIYCVEFWLTTETFRTLVGGHSATADVKWHLESSSHYLQTLAQQLTLELERFKDMCDHEVNTLTDIFFATVNMQTSMFTTTLQRLCYEARKDNCDKLTVYQSTGGRIVGCNFLPLQAQTYHDLSLSSLDAAIMKKVAPLLELVRWMLVLSTSVVVAILCLRLLCQAVTSTVRNYLLLKGHLPRVRVYQSEEQHLTAGQANTTMQRSQSWVESCESGVYLGETEDANKDESR